LRTPFSAACFPATCLCAFLFLNFGHAFSRTRAASTDAASREANLLKVPCLASFPSISLDLSSLVKHCYEAIVAACPQKEIFFLSTTGGGPPASPFSIAVAHHATFPCAEKCPLTKLKRIATYSSLFLSRGSHMLSNFFLPLKSARGPPLENARRKSPIFANFSPLERSLSPR